jgi:TetR/AcrR family transcriptional regulator, transcriptional repressor for nem operon
MTERSYFYVVISIMTKAEKTRQFIIEKSAPIFNVKGVAGTAMSDIMEATQLAKGSLYVHFENKEELCSAVVDYHLRMVLDGPLGEANKKETAKAKLCTFLDALVNRHPPITGGCPMLNFGMEADDTSPMIRKKVNNVIEKILGSIQSFLEIGIKAGEFKNDWKADVFAVKAFALIEGGIMMAKLAGSHGKKKMVLEIIKNEIEENSV